MHTDRKALTAMLALAAVVFLLILSGCSEGYGQREVSERLIGMADSSGTTGTAVSMREVTDFEWEKMIIFQDGCPEADIEMAGGAEFMHSTDFWTGMVFVNRGEIVFEEYYSMDPERGNMFQLWMSNELEGTLWTFSPEDANFTIGKIPSYAEGFDNYTCCCRQTGLSLMNSRYSSEAGQCAMLWRWD
jgi:hypothetical protein